MRGLPVAALLITSADDVLFAVRDPDANRTFPNTISVPTQRIPSALAEALTAQAEPEETADGEVLFRPSWSSNRIESGHSPLIFAVESIFTRKLGLAEELETGALDFDTTLASTTFGLAKHGNLDDPDQQVEPVEMLTMVVRVRRGKSTIPRSTATYRRLEWASKTRFVAAVRDRDPLVLIPNGHPAELCVQGVCTYASARLIEASRA
jgi:hypothetical protein